MSVSTSILSNHKIITDPTNTHEVSKVLGRASLDVGALCSSGAYINRWARYKPVKWGHISSLGQWNASGSWSASSSKWLESGGDISTNGKWWKSASQNCGITIRVFTDLVTMLNDWLGKEDYSWRDYWQYAPPTGGSSEPYRLTDFAGYCHFHTGGEDFDKPIANWLMDSVQTQYRDSQYTWVIGGQATIQQRLHGGKYLLELGDISIPSGAALSSLADMYFGVAFVFNYTANASNRQYACVTSSYKFNEQGGVDTTGTEHSSGLDLRMTPTFSTKTLGSVGEYMAFPILSKTALVDNGLSDASNPIQMIGRSTFAGTFVPLPYFGKKITVERAENKYQIILTVDTTNTTLSSFKVKIQVKNVSDSSGTVVWSNIGYFVDCYPLFSDGGTDYASGVHNDDVSLPSSFGSETVAAGSTSTTKTVSITPASSSNTGYFIQMNFHGMSVWDISDAVISYEYKV